MLQLDLKINLNIDSPGKKNSDGLSLCLHRVEELDKLINDGRNTQVLWKKIMGNSGFIFDMFTWPENVMLLSMMNPDHDSAFSALSHGQRREIERAIMEVDIDLDRPDIFLCSEHDFREYQEALHETIEKFIWRFCIKHLPSGRSFFLRSEFYRLSTTIRESLSDFF